VKRIPEPMIETGHIIVILNFTRLIFLAIFLAVRRAFLNELWNSKRLSGTPVWLTYGRSINIDSIVRNFGKDLCRTPAFIRNRTNGDL